MSETDIFLSNGTCYYGPGWQAHRAMIPCGNSHYYGPLTCCQQGDVCLSSNACYNGEFGVTYLAGCSDPDYQDPSCPDKGAFKDEPWIGLVYCNGTSNEWTACAQAESSDTLAAADHCWCPDEPRTVAFTASSILENRVELGKSILESVVYQPGHAPTRRLSSDAVAATASLTSPPAPGTDPAPPSAKTSPTAPIETSTIHDVTANAAQSEGFPARIGIGIGAGVGLALVLLVAGLVLLNRWRRRRRRDQASTAAAEKLSAAPFDVPAAPRQPQPAAPGTPELEALAARPWSTRSELPDMPRSSTAEMESPIRGPIGAEKSRRLAQSRRPLAGPPCNGHLAELP